MQTENPKVGNTQIQINKITAIQQLNNTHIQTWEIQNANIQT